jgi:hypothetical protein
MQGEHPLPPPVIEKFAKTGGQLAKNVYLLREFHILSHVYDVLTCTTDKTGVITTAHGLRIACLGGIYDANLYSASDSVHVCVLYSQAMLEPDRL